MSGHTAGPWAVVHVPKEPEDGDYTGCDEHFLVVSEGGENIIGADDSHGCCDYPGKTWPVIAEANARLIAAAPELLEAVKQLLAYAKDTPNETPTRPNIHLVQRAEAAIAKAEGK